jgi:hypothetical protein
VKQAGESLEMQNMAAEIKFRAGRRAGEMLGRLTGSKEDAPQKTGHTLRPVH